ncbi:beta-mannosidase [Paenibacillus nasutitermitis]|uniref:Beta-mannosidase B n=1 Tax=Paenibacillus nasutitermitis TaxID=1652958 RepID=A0A917E1B1_9BACL|nr:glycoside hydrolase family 2 protein [Paenibacillus nasutitermitis]GGD89021.1 beta-mannosidase [Paenibacillus nasutitermitis]
MKSRIQLNDNWTITGFGENGEIVGPINGTVPGHVHTDLLREGLIPDPLWRDQALQTQWVESFDWLYETEFIWPEGRDRDHAVLTFEGLDTVASISLNGITLGTAANMFIAHSFAAKEALLDGSNRLEVRFTSIPAYMKDKDVGRYMSLFSEDRVFVRRMQCSFGWDWVHRLVSYGIWRPVYAETAPEGVIEDVCMRTVGLEAGAASLRSGGGTARLEWEAAVLPRARGSRLQLELIAPDGRIVWENSRSCDEWLAEQESGKPDDEGKGSRGEGDGDSEGEVVMLRGSFELESPRLWWPAGYGLPELYTLRTALLSADGKRADERSDEIGIRMVEVEQLADAQGRSFTIVINGERIFAKGGNWVPADPFPSAVSPERYDHLLQMLVDGNMNMLRVWGGGTYELPAFWAACNRLGIMVSLDFMMACAHYPEREQWFLDEMNAEVAQVVRSLRNHPSLVFFCGDNELAMHNNAEDDYAGKYICAQVTAPLCAELDPTRPFFPTSPYGGKPFNSEDEGDCHYSTWYDPQFILGDMTDYRERICEGRGRFLSESVVVGAPPLASLLKMMTMEDVTDEAAAMWEFRTKDNPYNGQDELTHYRMLEKTAHDLFGADGNPLARVKKLEYVQYEFARLMGEHYRRRKYATSGLLFWMYGDCWPASGCAMVDYYGLPKAGYYGAKKAFKPFMVSLENRGEELGVWISNDTRYDQSGAIIVRAARTNGESLSERNFRLVAPANASLMIGKVSKAEAGLLPGVSDVVVEAFWQPDERSTPGSAANNDRTIYFDVLPKDLTLPEATLRVNCVPHDDRTGVIEIATNTYARVVAIEEELLLSDNYFDLMPGECRRIEYRALQPVAWRDLPKVSCWNGR